MPVSISGTSGVTYPDSSTQASSQVGMKNRIIDGGFTINQRVYVTNTALSSGVYGHDRWKAGSGGCTYTFTQGSLGVNTTITITAGTLVQVIEGCNLAEGGTYVLSWTGTAQGRLNGGTYGSSGTVVITGWTAGTNLNVEFNTGTLGSVQLEKGSTATSFDYRPYGTELALCQRYYEIVGSGATGAWRSSTGTTMGLVYKVPKRGTPTASATTSSVSVLDPATAIRSTSSFSITTPDFINTTAASIDFNGFSSGTAQRVAVCYTDCVGISAEL